MTSNQVIPFNGGDIRTTEHEGSHLAYMPDVAKTFGLRPDNVIRSLDAWDYISAGQGNPSDLRGYIDSPNPSPFWLTEAGIWHLAYRVSADLRKKINEEVLPALRRTGTYTAAKPQVTSEAKERAKLTRRVRSIRTTVAGDGPVDAEVQRYLLGLMAADDLLDIKAEHDKLWGGLAAIRTQLDQVGQIVVGLHQSKELYFNQLQASRTAPVSNYNGTPEQDSNNPYI